MLEVLSMRINKVELYLWLNIGCMVSKPAESNMVYNKCIIK